MEELNVLGSGFIYVLLLFVLYQLAKAKGYIVKVEYSQSKRVFWSLANALIIASMYFISDNFFFILLGIFFGYGVYSQKQYYGFKLKKS